MGKFKARYVVIPILCLAVGGTAFVYVSVHRSKEIVNVAPVSEVQNEFNYMDDEFGAAATFYGKLEKGSFVNVKTDPELKIDSVNVKKGDTVKKGDVLITYDTHSLKDGVSDAQLQVKMITNEIQILDNDLSVLRQLQPSENAPAEDDGEPEDADSDETADVPQSRFAAVITERTMPVGGSGTQSDPLMYMAGVDTVISKEALAFLGSPETPVTAIVYVCSEDGAQLYAWLIDGSKIDAGSVSDFPVSTGVTVTPDGMIAYSGAGVEFAAFLTSAGAPMQGGSAIPEGYEMPEEYANYEVPEMPADSFDQSNELSLNDHYKYSAQEIRDMISSKEKEKSNLERQKKQAELNVKKFQKRAETGGEVAEIDGKVTFVAKDINHLSESGAYITVTNDAGMSVTSTVGEFSIDKVEVGTAVNLTNFETGALGTGVITEIGDLPVDQGGDSMASSMESQYSFTVTLDNEMEIGADSEVQISVPVKNADNVLILPGVLIRKEAGRSYVYIADENGLLKKQYITIGEQQYEINQVIGGLSPDDKIAFPYGNAKEGAQTKETDFYGMYYGTMMFY